MTEPAVDNWLSPKRGFRRFEATVVVGRGDAVWERAAADLLRWKVKTRSGFRVSAAGPVRVGERLAITVGFWGVTVTEPVEVVHVVSGPSRVGFAYSTLPGHPVSGEEAFIVHRDGDQVLFTLRSLTRAASQQPWRALFPVLLVAQKVVRWRYFRALG